MAINFNSSGIRQITNVGHAISGGVKKLKGMLLGKVITYQTNKAEKKAITETAKNTLELTKAIEDAKQLNPNKPMSKEQMDQKIKGSVDTHARTQQDSMTDQQLDDALAEMDRAIKGNPDLWSPQDEDLTLDQVLEDLGSTPGEQAPPERPLAFRAEIFDLGTDTSTGPDEGLEVIQSQDPSTDQGRVSQPGDSFSIAANKTMKLAQGRLTQFEE